MGQTLRQYLDTIHLGSGSDAGLVVVDPTNGAEMHVSRRYLEGPIYNYLLDLEIENYVYPYVNVFGLETIKFFLKEKSA